MLSLWAACGLPSTRKGLLSTLVTGAAGFIGSHLAEALLRAGEPVVGLDNLDPFYAISAKERNLDALRAFPHYRDVRGDIRDPGAWEALPDDVDAVVHLAARAGVRPSLEQPALYADVNVTGTTRMLEFARVRRVSGIVFGSSSSVYGESSAVPFSERARADDPISPYAATKRAGELLCRAAHRATGMSVVVTRLFTVYGPRQRPDLAVHKFARLLLQGRPIPRYGDGTSARDYTYVDDAVAGIGRALALARRDGGVFETVNVGSDHPIELNELIRVLGEEMGVEPAVEQHPHQPGDVTRTWADLTHARALLGYSPSMDFREGVRSFVRWLESERTADR
jgi:UDP-glucuronate 4-epimerase